MGHISNPATGGLYRVAGTGQQNGLSRPWSLILKIAQLAEDAPQGWGSDLLHFGYWKREALAYESGILENLGTNLRALRCFEVEEQSDGSVWLWLEEIPGSDQASWPVARYGQAAHHFRSGAGILSCGPSIARFALVAYRLVALLGFALRVPERLPPTSGLLGASPRAGGISHSRCGSSAGSLGTASSVARYPRPDAADALSL